MPSIDGDLSENELGRPDADAANAFTNSITPQTRIDADAVEQLSRTKGEPEWMAALRLRALRSFDEQSMAGWFAFDMAHIDVHDIDRFEAVHHDSRVDLEEQGILFCDMDTALREHPHLVEEYFGTVVPLADNKVSALNTAVWTGGTFIYVPPGVEAEVPLQSSVGSDSERAGRFARTLIIADEGSVVHYIEGCSAPVYTTDSLRAAVVEIVVKPHARVTHTSIQNWSPNVDNLLTKRARVEAHGHMEWIDGNIGSKLTVTCPAVHLVGEGASCDVLSVAYSGGGQHQDTGAEVVHAAPNTTSKIVSKSISKGGGITTSRWNVRVEAGSTGVTTDVECDALTLDEQSVSTSLPLVEVGESDAQIGHVDTVSKVARQQLFYLMSRGLSEEQAVGVIVNGFIEPITRMLPTEYAVEWARLIELQMEGSVG